jgi:O-antigen/teichoic acid export membrane protein
VSLRENTLKGFIWAFVGSFGSGFLNFLIIILLARLLEPDDFGIAEILIVFIAISSTIVDSGFSQALIREKTVSQKDLSSVFYFNLFVAVSIYIILFFSSPIISSWFGVKELIDYSRFAFLILLFESLSLIQNTIFTRDLNFKPYTKASLISVIISGGIAIYLAYKGFGIWALLVNMVLSSFFRMILLWIQSTWRPSFQISVSSIKKFLKFGGNLLLQGIIDKVVSNLESIIIGKYYSKESLGYFSQARKIDQFVTRPFILIVQRVTYPSLSKLDDDSLKEGYRKILKISMFFVIPMAVFLFFSAHNIIFVLFGEKWKDSIPFLRLWSVIGLFVSFYSIFINIFLVKGKTRRLLYISIIRQILRVSSIVIFVRYSVIAMTYGILIVTFISTILYIRFGADLIKYKVREIIGDMGFIITYSLISGIFSYTVFYFKIVDGNLGTLILQFLSMTLLYSLLLIGFRDPTFQEIREMAIDYLKKAFK